MIQTIEKIILHNLLKNEEYTRKVIPFLKEEYFMDRIEKIIFNSIHSFIIKYNSLPSKDTIVIDLSNAPLSEDEFKEATSVVDFLYFSNILLLPRGGRRRRRKNFLRRPGPGQGGQG